MFPVFLAFNFLVSLFAAACIVLLLYRPAINFLKHHFHGESVSLWGRLICTGVVVAAIGVGARVWDMEGFIATTGHFDLTRDQIALEIYKTAVATMQVVALLLFVLLVIVGIALALKRKSTTTLHNEPEGEK